MSHIQSIALSRIIPHEPAYNKKRLQNIPEIHSPVIVKPIKVHGQEYMYLVQGHHRCIKAMLAQKETIDVYIAPPDFWSRQQHMAQYNLSKCPEFPLKAMRETDNDRDRQIIFHQEMGRFSTRPALSTSRGTMLKQTVDLADGDIAYKNTVLTMKGNISGLILSPEHAINAFKKGTLCAEKIHSCWGDESAYAPYALPAYIELSRNGRDMRGGGAAYDVAFQQKDYNISNADMHKRPLVNNVETLVIYPDGNMWQGNIDFDINETALLIWDDALVQQLAHPDWIDKFYNTRDWWGVPTTLIIGKESITNMHCDYIGHSCGSSCIGGGCTA